MGRSKHDSREWSRCEVLRLADKGEIVGSGHTLAMTSYINGEVLGRCDFFRHTLRSILVGILKCLTSWPVEDVKGRHKSKKADSRDYGFGKPFSRLCIPISN